MPLRCYCPSIQPLILISRWPLIAHTDSVPAYSRMSVMHEVFSIFIEDWQGLCDDARHFKYQVVRCFFLIYIMAIRKTPSPFRTPQNAIC
jgi:hypothetical protein